MKELQAIDTMCRPFYCDPDISKLFPAHYEWKIAATAVLGNLMKKLGLQSGEEWKIMASMGKTSVEEMVAEMDEIGVEYVFMDQMKFWSRREATLVGDVGIETLAEIIEKSNGRVIGGAGYNPFRIRESLQEIERAVREYGFKYVWFHPISFGLAPNDRKCYPLYAKCLDLGIPVCYQCGHSAEPLPSEPGHPMYADEVAMDFPESTLVLTHTGWPWIDEWMSMIWRHPNVYGNIGAYYPSALDPSLIRFMDSSRGRDKIFWATNGYGLTRCKKEFLELSISNETKRKVLRDNAIIAFKL